MPPFPDAGELLMLSTRLCCVGVVLESLETLTNWRELPAGHLLGWEASTQRTSNPLVWLARRLYAQPLCGLIQGARLLAAAACFFLPFGSWVTAGVLGGLVLGQMYFNRRFLQIFGNSDHMLLVGLAANCIGGLPLASPRLRAAALMFMAFQCLLAYFVAGYDKLKSALWRDGTRLVQIYRDGNHRVPLIGNLMHRHRALAWAGSWSVTLLELIFPLCLVLPSAGFWAFIAGGLLFHAAISFTMGLHGFWWAFIATYPALYFVHAQILGLLGWHS